ncbi:putative toxin-antitoxin system toxin component, PIN family [Thermoflexus sp.]|uniref:PIN domain-containing protein n=1 Tax=Thermoflexus sp. TaxID=1969742 RepID=UPI0035E41705
MNPPLAKVFLDTSVIFAAILSPQGGARMVLRLGEIGYLRLLAGPQVLRECEEVVRRKAPDSLPDLALLLDTARLEVTGEASPEALEQAQRWLSYPPDARILAEALEAGADWLVTHDARHFLAVPPDVLPLRIGTPGDLLAWIRELLTRQAR